jgi:hypothetical protein
LPEPNGGVVRAFDLKHGAPGKTHRREILSLTCAIGESAVPHNLGQQKILANQQCDELLCVIESGHAKAVVSEVEPSAFDRELHETVDQP